MLDAFDTYRDRLTSAPAPAPLRRMLGLAAHAQRNLSRLVRTRLKGKSSAAYTAHKFPGLTEEALALRIAKFRALDPALPDVRPVKLRDSIFALEAAG
jgi:hypothetical protein